MSTIVAANDSQLLAEVFEQHEVEGTLIIQKLGAETVLAHDIERAGKRYSPASTFKIPNTLIGLSLGVIKSEHSRFEWDGQARWLDAWNQDHDLLSAFRVSCLWCYQQIAQQLSLDSYKKELVALNYGNQDAGNALTGFWLDGSLAISAKEQISFLTRLINNTLPYPTAHQNLTKRIMLERDTGHHQLYAKTGWAAGNINVGWYVGYVVKPNETWVFAMNMDLVQVQHAPLRKKVVLDSLVRLGLIKEDR